MKKCYIFILLLILILLSLSCKGLKSTDTDLTENREQRIVYSEQVTQNDEELAEDSEQAAEDSDQAAEDSEQIAEQPEQMPEEQAQLPAQPSQVVPAARADEQTAQPPVQADMQTAPLTEQAAENSGKGIFDQIGERLKQLFDPFTNIAEADTAPEPETEAPSYSSEPSELTAEAAEQEAESPVQIAEIIEQAADSEPMSEQSEQIAKDGGHGILKEIEEVFRQLFDPSTNITEAIPAEEQVPLAQALPQTPAQPQARPTPQTVQPPPAQPTPPAVQPQTQLQAQPTPQARPTPPTVQPQPPVQPTPPTPVQETPPLLTEEEPEPKSETPPPLRQEPQRIFPNTPAPRVEPLAQRGAVPQGENIVFSRIIRVTAGQILEIPFRGNGWVYLGEMASRRGIVYNSRRTEPEGMSFVFNVEEAGTFALKFFREDFTRGFILNDYVQVIAGEAQQTGTGWFAAPSERGRVIAQPRWPTAVEEAEIRSTAAGRTPGISPSGTAPETAVFTPGSVPSSQPAVQEPLPEQALAQTTMPAQETPSLQETSSAQRTAPTQGIAPASGSAPIQRTPAAPAVTQTPSPLAAERTQEFADTSSPLIVPPQPSLIPERQETVLPGTLIQNSKETFDSGNVSGAISLLDQYMIRYPGGSDEAYWLYGQYYEANSPSRNILRSLDYYRRLVNEYPQSSRTSEARRRIVYLERFYINIR